MERKDLVAIWDKALERLSVEPSEATSYALRISAGTSGKGPLIAPTKFDQALLRSWLGGAERTLACYGPRGTRLFNVLNIDLFGGKVLTVGVEDIAPERAALLEEFMPTRIVGYPTFVLRVAEAMSAQARSGVVSLRLAGELLSETMEGAMQALFPNAELVMQYVTSEVGAVSRPSCGYLPRNTYHPADEVSVVIDSPDEAGVGEILVSKIMSGERIVEYHTGDLGRSYPCSCRCGETTALELRGRAGTDYLKLAGAVLRIEEFDRAISAYKDYVDDYRVEATTRVGKDGPSVGVVQLLLRWSGALPTSARKQEIANEIAGRLFVTPTRTLSQLVAEGLFDPLEVKFSSESLPGGYKTSKMRYLS